MVLFISLILLLILFSGCVSPANDSQQGYADCNTYSAEECPEQCVICPPCAYCSSISCQTEEFCKSMGFDKNWWDQSDLMATNRIFSQTTSSI